MYLKLYVYIPGDAGAFHREMLVIIGVNNVESKSFEKTQLVKLESHRVHTRMDVSCIKMIR